MQYRAGVSFETLTATAKYSVWGWTERYGLIDLHTFLAADLA